MANENYLEKINRLLDLYLKNGLTVLIKSLIQYSASSNSNTEYLHAFSLDSISVFSFFF